MTIDPAKSGFDALYQSLETALPKKLKAKFNNNKLTNDDIKKIVENVEIDKSHGMVKFKKVGSCTRLWRWLIGKKTDQNNFTAAITTVRSIVSDLKKTDNSPEDKPYLVAIVNAIIKNTKQNEAPIADFDIGEKKVTVVSEPPVEISRISTAIETSFPTRKPSTDEETEPYSGESAENETVEASDNRTVESGSDMTEIKPDSEPRRKESMKIEDPMQQAHPKEVIPSPIEIFQTSTVIETSLPTRLPTDDEIKPYSEEIAGHQTPEVAGTASTSANNPEKEVVESSSDMVEIKPTPEPTKEESSQQHPRDILPTKDEHIDVSEVSKPKASEEEIVMDIKSKLSTFNSNLDEYLSTPIFQRLSKTKDLEKEFEKCANEIEDTRKILSSKENINSIREDLRQLALKITRIDKGMNGLPINTRPLFFNRTMELFRLYK